MKPSTLIVYAQIPERTDFYVVPNEVITAEQAELLELAHGMLVNGDEMNPGMDFLMNAVCDAPEHCSPESPPQWRCVWAKFKREVAPLYPLTDVQVTRIVYSGFIL